MGVPNKVQYGICLSTLGESLLLREDATSYYEEIPHNFKKASHYCEVCLLFV